jgi:hypothetical protein
LKPGAFNKRYGSRLDFLLVQPIHLGAAADVVELETHEGLDQSGLAVRLVADDEDGGGVEGLIKLLRRSVGGTSCI